MVEIISEMIVKENARGLFELAFGPGGAWERLVSRSPGFRGTTLLRDAEDPRRYLVVEMWEAETHRQATLAEHMGEYEALKASLAEWTESKAELGAFRMVREASVRPRAAGRKVATPGVGPSRRGRH